MSDKQICVLERAFEILGGLCIALMILDCIF